MHLGTPEEGEQFLAKRWPEARAVSDPTKRLFHAFGLGRGSLSQFIAPSVWVAGVRAVRFGVGLPTGDPLMLAGTFAVHGAEVIDADVAENSASVPDLDRLAASLAGR